SCVSTAERKEQEEAVERARQMEAQEAEAMLTRLKTYKIGSTTLADFNKDKNDHSWRLFSVDNQRVTGSSGNTKVVYKQTVGVGRGPGGLAATPLCDLVFEGDEIGQATLVAITFR